MVYVRRSEEGGRDTRLNVGKRRREMGEAEHAHFYEVFSNEGGRLPQPFTRSWADDLPRLYRRWDSAGDATKIGRGVGGAAHDLPHVLHYHMQHG